MDPGLTPDAGWTGAGLTQEQVGSVDGSSVRLKVRGEGILAKLLSGILAGGRPASGSGWGQRDEDFDPISRQGFLVKLASRGPCREWILAGTAQMAAGSFAFSGGLSPICDMQGGWSVLGTPGLRDTWATKAAGPQAQPGPPWIPHCDSSHEVQHRRSLLRMFSYQHRNLPPTEVKNDPQCCWEWTGRSPQVPGHGCAPSVCL